MNIMEIFPTSIFVDKNISLLEEANEIFDRYNHLFIGNNDEFKTTLSGYNPYKAKVTLDVLEKNLMPNLVNYINISVLKYLEVQEYENYEVKIVNLWLNEMIENQSHEFHHHYGYTLSGCFYPQCPDNSNIVQFINPLKSAFTHKLSNKKSINKFNSEVCEIEIDAGSLIIFPSFLKHGVPMQEFNGIRRSIAFDIILT